MGVFRGQDLVFIMRKKQSSYQQHLVNAYYTISPSQHHLIFDIKVRKKGRLLVGSLKKHTENPTLMPLVESQNKKGQHRNTKQL